MGVGSSCRRSAGERPSGSRRSRRWLPRKLPIAAQARSSSRTEASARRLGSLRVPTTSRCGTGTSSSPSSSKPNRRASRKPCQNGSALAAEFVHLHVHSEYSILDGACRIPQLAERAAELEMPAVAITDHGSLAGAVELYQQAGKHGVKPLI